jgi:Uma2 family endonuclease
MDTTVPAPKRAALPQPAPYRITRAQYERMIDAGVFEEDDRVELVEGTLRPMSPQNLPHSKSVVKTHHALMDICPEGHVVVSQIPVGLGELSTPEPDAAILEGSAEDLSRDDRARIRLLVEVADTSLDFDRTTKRRLYARHDVPEYWIVNLQDGHVEMYREPTGDDYGWKRTVGTDGSVAPDLVPDASIAVDSLLPAR